MSKQPTDSQIKKFWEWCGFRKSFEDVPQSAGIYFGNYDQSRHIDWDNQPKPTYRREERWRFPKGDKDNPYSYYPFQLPPINLNNLFKWAVPKITTGRLIAIAFDYSDAENEVRCRITEYYLPTKSGKSRILATGYAKDPAYALFWACQQIMEMENEHD